MIDLDLRHLRSFLAVARESSITKAAARRHMTQQGLSQHIQNLERTLGVALLVRTPRGIALTAAGEELVAGASTLMTEVAGLAERVRAAATARVGRIRLVSAAFTVTRFSIEIARSMEAAYPGVAVEIATAQRPVEAMRRMLEGTSDAALMWLPTGENRLNAEQLRADPRVVLVAEDHRLANRESVSLAELAEDPVVIVDAFGSRAALDHRIADPRPDGARAVRGPVVPTVEECLTQVRQGNGVWFAPRVVADWAVCDGLRLIPVTDLEPAPLAVVWSPTASPELVRLLVTHIRSRLDEF